MKTLTKKLIMAALLLACIAAPMASAITTGNDNQVQTCGILGDLAGNF